MPRAGFHNDNEYRAYPFIAKTAYSTPTPLPDSAIVDCGFIMGLDSGFVADTDSVYLARLTRTATDFIFEFRTTATAVSNYAITFIRPIEEADWANISAEADINTADGFCAEDPAWEGYIVVGPVAALLEFLPAPGVVVFSDPTDYVVEPARIQSLVRAYLRSISVGNYERVKIPVCATGSSSSSSSASGERQIVVNAECLKNDVKIKAGYNCAIQQTAADNTITVVALKDANLPDSTNSELCQYGSELPLHEDEFPPILRPATAESPAVYSEFLSGGPACKDLITAINGISGKNVKIIAGTGVQILPNGDHGITIGVASNIIQQNC